MEDFEFVEGQLGQFGNPARSIPSGKVSFCQKCVVAKLSELTFKKFKVLDHLFCF